MDDEGWLTFFLYGFSNHPGRKSVQDCEAGAKEIMKHLRMRRHVTPRYVTSEQASNMHLIMDGQGNYTDLDGRPVIVKNPGLDQTQETC